MKNKKALKMGLSLLLVGVVGVGATLAYLSDKTDTMTNTFTVGKGYDNTDENSQALVLDETALNGAAINSNFPADSGEAGRTLDGVNYTFTPGADYLKDPDVHLRADSVASYVFVKIEGLDELLAAKNSEDKAYFTNVNLNTGNWKRVADVVAGDVKDGYYVYTIDGRTPLILDDTYTDTEEDKYGVEYYNLNKLFTELTPNDAITQLPVDDPETVDVDERKLPNIDIKACAVQTSNIEYTVAQEEAIKLLSSK